MSGGPPHHPPHGRQVPPSNTAWNHLQVPNYFPTRQPQHAHMSNEHSVLHQPTWHTPTTEPSMKTIPHSHIFSLEQMLSERQFTRHTPPGVDLSLQRNGSSTQNGDMVITTPISLSVRDTNKINSLPVSALDIQPIEIASNSLKPISPASLKSLSPNEFTKSKRSSKRVDSILERLNPNLDKSQTAPQFERSGESELKDSSSDEKHAALKQSVIVQAASSHDENSNSSSILNVPTPTNLRDDDVVSPYSNEDSLDSNKSRRKRKPSKTIRLTKDEDKPVVQQPDQSSTITPPPVIVAASEVKTPAETKLQHPPDSFEEETPAAKTRRKTSSSESETIDNIAAMVQEGLETQPAVVTAPAVVPQESKSVSVSVIKTKSNLQEALLTSETSDLSNSSNNVTTTELKNTPASATTTNCANQFVEVENKLEEMFAGIEDGGQNDEENNISASTSQDNVTSTSNELVKKSPKKIKRNKSATRRRSDNFEKKKQPVKKQTKHVAASLQNVKTGSGGAKKKNAKSEVMAKDVYAYDSGSNASSSRSRGPFIQIRGPRDSPLSVSVVNTTNDDENEKKANKSAKKFHDDSEYRHKVRSKGLHCSTLSHQYDSQTKDATWICAFCKRGPHATETGGPTLNCAVPAPGDLFGPYFITTNSPEFERRLDDPYDKQFKSKKIARSLVEQGVRKKMGGGGGGGGKRKLSVEGGAGDDSNEIYWGMTATSSGTYEIWAHEDCIVWSTGIYLVGPKIIGLEEAVWTSCNVMCGKCQLKGANICCLKRGCVQVAHVCCARLTNWEFDEDNYKTFCPEHRVL